MSNSLGLARPCPTCNYGERIGSALSIAFRFGGIDGAHHKTWVIDQMVRALLTDEGDDGEYERFVRMAKAVEDGQDTYEWDEGIAP